MLAVWVTSIIWKSRKYHHKTELNFTSTVKIIKIFSYSAGFYVFICNFVYCTELNTLVPFLSYGSQFTVFLSLHDSSSEQVCMDSFLSRRRLILCFSLAMS